MLEAVDKGTTLRIRKPRKKTGKPIDLEGLGA